ncbi:hypothetical protein ACQPWW_23325 [Micromonospora sp. CA-240977]|uniref:MmyB family transcriptional regulator n=1 Tax=Micromonospora sp. CA-240977 TaxID=3239957 RepID=UPI003D8EAB8F
MFENTVAAPNIARFIFLDPASRDFYLDWEELAARRLLRPRPFSAEDPSRNGNDTDACNLHVLRRRRTRGHRARPSRQAPE